MNTLKLKQRQKHQQGFTLIELMIVIAIIAIIAVLAAPNMLNMLHKSQLNQETRGFIAYLNEARAEAVLKRKPVQLGGAQSTNTVVIAEWQPDKTLWEKAPIGNIRFDYMGRANVPTNNAFNCLILTHKKNSEFKSVIVIYQQGTVRYLKNDTQCPSS